MYLLEAINELEKVKNIYISIEEEKEFRIIAYKEDGIENLNKHRLPNVKIYNTIRTGNEEAIIKVREWGDII